MNITSFRKLHFSYFCLYLVTYGIPRKRFGTFAQLAKVVYPILLRSHYKVKNPLILNFKKIKIQSHFFLIGIIDYLLCS